MSHYADSSFLVSCYYTDSFSARAKQHLGTLAEPIVFTPLHAVEVRNALQLRAFRGESTQGQVSACWDDLIHDLRANRLVRSTLRWSALFTQAARLSEFHSAVLGTRSLDVLHVAAAQSLRTNQFISFDTRQRALASAVGLTVAP